MGWRQVELKIVVLVDDEGDVAHLAKAALEGELGWEVDDIRLAELDN